ncbi:MAG: hypothetical protein DRR11_01150 [Gammaproteobacteria bacterium]|nr:MAG: hypothetical protein DRR11_01150 [Gammaproteobacteria bacterium]RLA36946.1 MAG: hypothetical protein DRR15_03475 [Gammaproteobacteria bacterium]
MLAIACNIDLNRHEVANRVLKNDSSVCRRKNPAAFEKLRHHLMAFFPLENKAIENLSAENVGEILNEVRASIRALRDAGKGG